MGIRGQFKNKRDKNEPEIFATLRAFGLSVCPIDTPADALVGYGGRTYLVEVKMPKGPMTEPQEKFTAYWLGNYQILRTVDDAEAFARGVRGQDQAAKMAGIPLKGCIS